MGNQLLENTLRVLDKILPFIVLAFGISLIFFLLVSALYSVVWYQKKANLKKSEEIIEDNRQVVEDAQFMYQNKKYTKVIEEQIAQIKELHLEAKKLRAANEESELDMKRNKKSGKKQTDKMQAEDSDVKSNKKEKSDQPKDSESKPKQKQ
ncbi:lipopolysaccharide export LptBFGC system permease protein LptF [Acholeplasma morum]|uniref:hypothetical protein n=1 Tax=Paracholeplasma morum TaxID=264637 RepID=UPI001959DD4A|nr:hypothetical protein [Paracholeplasma morum]MBM7454145.1 lipopolysaccharide export LptBFGC system permease protein LptF [Paracholeplasma morum]